MDEPWKNKEFFEMSRRQQNLQIFEVFKHLKVIPNLSNSLNSSNLTNICYFQVLAQTLATMTAGIKSSQQQLDEINKRVNRIETDLNLGRVPSNDTIATYKFEQCNESQHFPEV